jgi:hypothetical protein
MPIPTRISVIPKENLIATWSEPKRCEGKKGTVPKELLGVVDEGAAIC